MFWYQIILNAGVLCSALVLNYLKKLSCFERTFLTQAFIPLYGYLDATGLQIKLEYFQFSNIHSMGRGRMGVYSIAGSKSIFPGL